jgi:hypothetical protein
MEEVQIRDEPTCLAALLRLLGSADDAVRVDVTSSSRPHTLVA